ncbi:MAG TPA: XdhC/CoxI family protein [Solirubrobacteraceae bacterium]|nr:XdhC/CoxI family protein [Solirubrobacteraceae bacterium]
MSVQARFAAIAAAGGRAAVVTVLSDGAHQGAKLLVLPDGAHEGTLGDAALDDAAVRHATELLWAEYSERREEGDTTLFVDVVHPPPRLLVFGAVDYARALCTLARDTGWRAFVIDPRGRFATPERFPDAEAVVAAWPDKAVPQVGGIDPATAIAVLTHDPKLDDAALTLALRSGAGYIGAMGSRRAQADRRARLLEAGMTEEEIGRIKAPIGLDLGGLSAEETALSIMAEVVAARHGRAGGMLSASGGRIHEVRT